MARLLNLQALMPEVESLLMQAEGYGLWVSWQDEVHPVLGQTLEEFGGVRVVEETGQALWFFFGTDIFLASARLSSWSRFNQLPASLLIFPASLSVSTAEGKRLSLQENVWNLDLPAPTAFGVWAHTSLSEQTAGVPGVSLVNDPSRLLAGLDQAQWLSLEADGRLPYHSTMGWYAIVRPVGNPSEKAFQVGWREFFSEVEAVLQRNKFRFTIHDHFLMFSLEGVAHLRNWCSEFLGLAGRVKEENPDRYWPCVMAIVERKGLNFNPDLPQKVGLPWDQLLPDYPHVNIRGALMIGEAFRIHEVRFVPARHVPEDWVSISLNDDREQKSKIIPQLAPANLISGKEPYCFYCGQRSHKPSDCPTRHFKARDAKVWNRLAQMDFNAMRSAVRELDNALDGIKEKDKVIETLSGENTAPGVILKSLYDINWITQPRAMSFFWRVRTKDFANAASDMLPVDGNPIWNVLENYAETDPIVLEKELNTLSVRDSKDFRVMSLRGFVALDNGDVTKAQAYWREAEVHSPFPLIQSWHQVLQARLLEYQGQYSMAERIYGQVFRGAPGWWDLEYRRSVCLIKAGFSIMATGVLSGLAEYSGHYFNKALLDPEMDRGHVHIQSCLYALWVTMEARARDEINRLGQLKEELGTWFVPEFPFAQDMSERLQKILQASSISNFVAFQLIASSRTQLERELNLFVSQESRSMKAKFKSFAERLKHIHNESAWFPFPRALTDFNNNYNQGVLNTNWAAEANFHVAEAFRKAQTIMTREEERLTRLEGRLKFLRIIRDATIFLLSSLQVFFWTELVGVIVIFVLMPLILVYGDKIGLDWTASIIAQERWQVQKALFFVITVLALTVASMRTILRFDRIRSKTLAKAKSLTPRKKRK